MASSSDLPRLWDPERDSLEDLVRLMFDDEGRAPEGRDGDTATPTPTPGAAPPVAKPAPTAPPETAAAKATPTPIPSPRRPAGPGRLASPLLAGAILLALILAGWQLQGAQPPTPAAVARPADPTVVAAPRIVAEPTTLTVPAAPPPAPPPDPVGIGFGARADVGDGWRIAVTRPYNCDVLMAIPSLQQDGTRIVRVTITLINRTGQTQRAADWQLAATAGGTPAELVLWPAENFRGVPDVTLAPRRSVRFLVAVRIPEQRTELMIKAARAAAPRAILRGTL